MLRVWFENTGSRCFYRPSQSLGQRADFIYCGDVTGNGYLDIILGWGSSYLGIMVYENDGSSIVLNRARLNNRWPTYVSYGDIDDDGDIDMLYTSKRASSLFMDENEIGWFKNDGQGNFQNKNVVSNLIDYPSLIKSADVDHDGDLDLIVASYSGRFVTII